MRSPVELTYLLRVWAIIGRLQAESTAAHHGEKIPAGASRMPRVGRHCGQLRRPALPFTLRYASIYYMDKAGADLNEDKRPRCMDFAYLAFMSA